MGEDERLEIQQRLERLEKLFLESSERVDPSAKSPWMGMMLGHLQVIDLEWKRGHVVGVLCRCQGPSCTRPGVRPQLMHLTIKAIRKRIAPQGCPHCWQRPRTPKERKDTKTKSPTNVYRTEYVIWQRYRKEGVLCVEWARSFRAFFRDMGPKPGGMGIRLCRRSVRRLHSRGNSFWGSRDGDGTAVTWRGMRMHADHWYRKFGKPLFDLPHKFFEYHVYLKPEPEVDMDRLLVVYAEREKKRERTSTSKSNETGSVGVCPVRERSPEAGLPADGQPREVHPLGDLSPDGAADPDAHSASTDG